MSEGERALVVNAICSWHDQESFSDESVLRVKSLFRKLFSLPPDTVLVGSAVPDAVILSAPLLDRASAVARFFAVVKPEASDGRWECMQLDADCFISFSNQTRFRELVHLLNASANGPITVMSKRWGLGGAEDISG